jgi:hypothetical protein
MFAAGGQGITGAPYTALRKTTHVQKLADGTTITRESTEKEARDSEGRTYHESHFSFPAGVPGQAPFSHSVYNIFDPVNRVQINWNSNSKQANVSHMPEPGQLSQPQRPATLPQVRSLPARVAQDRSGIEDLGTKTINGVEAKGIRFTRVIPEGSEGNDRPLTVTSETWTSPDLKTTVLSIIDDPRNGTNTTELTDIDRAEPDPSLFQVPEGIAIKDQYPGQQN